MTVVTRHLVTFVCCAYHYWAITVRPSNARLPRSNSNYPRSIDLETSNGEHSASFGAADP
jgi:hypothetical protein